MYNIYILYIDTRHSFMQVIGYRNALCILQITKLVLNFFDKITKTLPET